MWRQSYNHLQRARAPVTGICDQARFLVVCVGGATNSKSFGLLPTEMCKNSVSMSILGRDGGLKHVSAPRRLWAALIPASSKDCWGQEAGM